MKIIDIHTHAFPDNVAEKAIPLLEEEGKIKAKLDGKISSLLFSMDKYGIEKSVICSIATKITQYNSILKWSKEISSERIIPFPSFHQDDPLVFERIEEIKKEGFKGIKLHPYYQKFTVDEEKMMKIYEKISKEGLILVLHTGFDFAFERIRIADPEKIMNVKKNFPDLKLITTHLGAWEDWDNVEKYLIGKEIYMEISFSLEFLEKERAKRMILSHPPDYILFGTDSPWTDQGETLNLLRQLKLPSDIEEKILYKNAERILFKKES
ncbi:MAG TPA: amidohydrolase family protein [bacterium]|nr:amidohydrolase family protein [bacterium]HOM26208.1 amidohydrolase family protein [bacterium]